MSKWTKQLDKMEGAVSVDNNPYAKDKVISSTSPSLNWIFGRGHGIPFGLSCIVYGPPKAGKSLISNLFVKGLHDQFPEAEAVKFNTEMREGFQTNLDMWGIDKNRYKGFDAQSPDLIFDRITQDFVPMLEAGWPLKLLIIDSMEGVGGVKAANKESILSHTIGDHSLTIGEGLKRILPIIRKYNIALLCTSHIRANIGAMGMHSPKTKMAGGYAQKHFFEYYVEVKRDNSADGKASIVGDKFESGDRDLKGNKDITGHKIWVKMSESSNGVAGRTGKFTLNYNSGLINVEEEIFELSKNTPIVKRPNNRTYIVNKDTFNGKKDFITAIKEKKGLKDQLLTSIYEKDNS